MHLVSGKWGPFSLFPFSILCLELSIANCKIFAPQQLNKFVFIVSVTGLYGRCNSLFITFTFMVPINYQSRLGLYYLSRENRFHGVFCISNQHRPKNHQTLIK